MLKHIPGARAPLRGPGRWWVLLELSDTVEGAGLEALLESVLGPAIEAGLVGDAAIAGSVAQAEALWALRENISEAQKIEGISIKHDVSLPVSRIPEFLARAQAALCAVWPDVRIVAFGHLGDGNLHYDLVAALDGAISAEHGLGQLKR